MIEPAGKVGRVQQTECRRCQAFVFLSPFGRVFDQLRGVPLREENAMAFGLQPLVQQEQLRALPGPVDTLDDDQFSGVGVGMPGDRGLLAHAESSCEMTENFTRRRNTRSKRSALPAAAQVSNSASPVTCTVMLMVAPSLTSSVRTTEKCVRSRPSATRSSADRIRTIRLYLGERELNSSCFN